MAADRTKSSVAMVVVVVFFSLHQARYKQTTSPAGLLESRTVLPSKNQPLHLTTTVFFSLPTTEILEILSVIEIVGGEIQCIAYMATFLEKLREQCVAAW